MVVSPLELVARATIVYLGFLIGLRLFGKREIGQFTLFDLALILLAANALQPAITGPDASVPGGAVVLVTMLTLNRAAAIGRRRIPFVRHLLELPATVIGRDGNWIAEALGREELDDEDLDAALREHGLGSVKEMQLAVLESDGSISIVAREGSTRLRARRRRYRKMK